MNERNLKKGVLYGLGAYILWGVLPVYWKILENTKADVVLAHRIVWSFVFMIVFIMLSKKLKVFLLECRRILHNKRALLIITGASVAISMNWLIFIWAVQNEQMVEVSLGYYINPLMSVLLGVLILKERLSKAQTFSFILAAIGVLYLTSNYGVFPWVSLSLAITFALYGLLKKLVTISSMFSLAIETSIMMPIALIYLFTMSGSHLGFTNESIGTNLLLLASGAITAIPLLLFGSSVQFIPLTTVGFLQYLAPTIMLFMGIFIYGETFTTTHLLAFTLIWISLIIYMITSVKGLRKEEIQRQKAN